MAPASHPAGLAVTPRASCQIVVLEAAAAGVPVAVVKIGDVLDLIEPEETGLLFDPADLHSVGAALAKLLANREYAEGLATQAKVRARERFHPQNIAARHLEIYSQIASSRPSAARTPAPEVGWGVAPSDPHAAVFEQARSGGCPTMTCRLNRRGNMPINIAVLHRLSSPVVELL